MKNVVEIKSQTEYLCKTILAGAPQGVSSARWIEQLASNGEHASAHIAAVADVLLFNLRTESAQVVNQRLPM